MDDEFIFAGLGLVAVLGGITIYLLINTIRHTCELRQAAMKCLNHSPDPAPAVHALNYQSPTQRIAPRPSAKVVGRSFFILLAYLLLAGIFVPIYQHFAYHTRHGVLTFVDSVTGAPVRVDTHNDAAFNWAQSDDYSHPDFDATNLAPNVIQFSWNCPFAFYFSPAGYKEFEIDVDDDSSPTVIKLQPIRASPTSSPGGTATRP